MSIRDVFPKHYKFYVLLPMTLHLMFVSQRMCNLFIFFCLYIWCFLVILPCFLPQRSWPVNYRAVKTNAWCCTAVWSAGPSATRCPASCSWKSESTTDTFSIWFLNGFNINGRFWGKSFHLSNVFSVFKTLVIFCFSPQPWRLAVLLIVFRLLVPPYWSQLGTSARRSSVSRKFTILYWERVCLAWDGKSGALRCILAVGDWIFHAYWAQLAY